MIFEPGSNTVKNNNLSKKEKASEAEVPGDPMSLLSMAVEVAGGGETKWAQKAKKHAPHGEGEKYYALVMSVDEAKRYAKCKALLQEEEASMEDSSSEEDSSESESSSEDDSGPPKNLDIAEPAADHEPRGIILGAARPRDWRDPEKERKKIQFCGNSIRILGIPRRFL